MTIVLENLNSYLLNIYGKYGAIEEKISQMVKSFYDPKVEEIGRKLEKIDVAKAMILEGEAEDKIKKYTGLNEKEINELKSLIKSKGEH